MKRTINRYLSTIKQWARATCISVIWHGLRLVMQIPWRLLIQSPSIARSILLYVKHKPSYLIAVSCHSRIFIGNALYFALEAHQNPNWLTFWFCDRTQYWHLYRRGFIPVLYGTGLERWLAKKADVIAYSGYYRKSSPIHAVKLLLWHGISLKGVGLQCRPFPDEITDGDIDLTIATSPFTANMMSAAFGLPKDKVLITGVPESDGLFPATTQSRKEFTDISWKHDARMVLYLPTWRENYSKISNGEYAPNNEIIEKELRALFNDQNIRHILTKNNAVMVVKLHPYSQVMIKGIHAPFYLLPTYSVNSETLMQNANVLISDYSGALVDWLITGRPAIAYAFDLHEYIGGRGIPNFNYEEMFRGIIVQNRIELADRLLVCLETPERLKGYIESLSKIFHTHRFPGASKRILAALEKRLSMRCSKR